MKVCVVIPSHNHHVRLAPIIEELRQRQLHIVLVDDGSEPATAEALAAYQSSNVTVIRLNENQGKGKAVETGFRWAAANGYTHAAQIDADGQHDLNYLSSLLEEAQKQPNALVTGKPVYDASIPLSRKIARWITHFWVWVETLSFQIKDSMCGFRVYPLQPALEVLEKAHVGKRMDFDTEIMVRMFWQGCAVISVPVRVTYPADNTSNFRVLKDNLLISWMHTRLFFEMLLRFPKVWKAGRSVGAQKETEGHWSRLGERGAYLGFRSILWTYKLFGRAACTLMLYPIVSYFVLTDGKRRAYSRDYLLRVYTRLNRREPQLKDNLVHYMNFAKKALDTVISWAHPDTVKMDVIGGEQVRQLAREGKGALIIVSHLGNAEICQAHLARHLGRDVFALMHSKNARLYNRMILSVRPEARNNTIEVSDIGASTMIALSERISNGDWVAIAGDRIPLSGENNVSYVSFLGENAPFSQGPYIMASLLECPVFLLFCMKEKDQYTAYFEAFSDKVILPRKQRQEALDGYAALYAERLQEYCDRYPEQWYNFYNFWGLKDR